MDGLNEPQPSGVTPFGGTSRERGLKLLEDRRKFRPHIYWYLSFRCNLACKHCSVFSSPWVDASQDLSTEECMRVVEQMKELDVGFAILTGGEILIRPDALDIMRALAAAGIPVGIETNGLRFDRPFVDLAREMQAAKLLQITVSLDGGTAETHERLRGPHSFTRTVRGLRFVAEHGIRFHVQCVLNRFNLSTIPDLYDLGVELQPSMKMLQFAFLNPVGRGIELARELGLRAEDVQRIFALIAEHQGRYSGDTLVKVPPAMVPPQYLGLMLQRGKVRQSISCQFPLLGVLPNGDVTICAVSRDNESLYFGNVRDLSLRAVWEKTRMDMLRSQYVAADHLSGICGDCVWKFQCKGGCRAWAYEDGGSFDAPLPLCKALDEAGHFPAAYRISYQNDVMVRKYQQMGGGCACH